MDHIVRYIEIENVRSDQGRSRKENLALEPEGLVDLATVLSLYFWEEK